MHPGNQVWLAAWLPSCVAVLRAETNSRSYSLDPEDRSKGQESVQGKLRTLRAEMTSTPTSAWRRR